MSLFILNVVFAVMFTALLGSGSLGIFLLGFVLGYAALWLSKPLYPDTRYFTKLPKTINLAGYFLKELLELAKDVVATEQQAPPIEQEERGRVLPAIRPRRAPAIRAFAPVWIMHKLSLRGAGSRDERPTWTSCSRRHSHCTMSRKRRRKVGLAGREPVPQ